jgi:hypothetical protein
MRSRLALGSLALVAAACTMPAKTLEVCFVADIAANKFLSVDLAYYALPFHRGFSWASLLSPRLLMKAIITKSCDISDTHPGKGT